MRPAQTNLFLRLHKWAVRQDENFVTESLALVLQDLLDREPAVGVGLLRFLTGGLVEVAPEDAATVDVRTQVETDRGRPDLEIRAQGCLIVVEVKVESDLQTGQLEGYRRYLEESGAVRKGLILLSQYRVRLGDEVEKPDIHRRWYEVAEWLDEARQQTPLANPVTRFLCNQFLDFLEARDMTISQVSGSLADGLRSLSSLLKMLEHAAASCRVSVARSSSWERIGLQLDKRHWIGVVYDEPERLRFQTEGGRIDPQAARGLGVGTVLEQNWAPGGFVWRRTEDLNSEQVHFYARSRARQMQWLEEFLAQSLQLAKQIEVQE